MDKLLISALQSEKAENYVQAINYYEQLLELMPNHYTALLNLGFLYFECYDGGFVAAHNIPDDLFIKSLTESMKHLQKGCEFYPESAEMIFWRGYVEYIYLDYTEPVAHLIQLAQKKGYPYACILSPFTHTDAETVETHILTAISQQPDNPDFRYRYFKFLQSQNRHKSAKNELELAIAYYHNYTQYLGLTVRKKYIYPVFHTINIPFDVLKKELNSISAR